MSTRPPLPTDRSFGFTFAVVFGVVAAWLLYKGSAHWSAALGISAIFAAAAVFCARVLHPFNVVWMWFGGVLNRVVSPVILGLIYFAVFTPVALFFAVSGRDALNRKFEPSKPSYWLDRTPPGPEAERSFPRQF